MSTSIKSIVSPLTPYQEVLERLDVVVRAGKALRIGASSARGFQLAKLQALAQAAMSLVCSGVGLLFVARPLVESQLASGELRLVLEDWATMGPGFYICYPGRRQVRNGLRLLTELIREMRPLGL